MPDLLGDTPKPPAATADQPYVGLALRWRPRRFDDLVGQSKVAQSLKNAIAQSRISQAYLFCGPRGVGKTSTARILARAINCVDGPTPEPCGKCDFCRSISAGSDMDVVEIDGASNNKVDDVRELREAVNFTPFAARYKVYIIDEVHMLSTGAFNALLKTLEEPPERVKFIFATTEPHKVPATIQSRCQVCVFGHVSEADMAARLKAIVDNEPSISIVPEQEAAVLDTIANYAQGSMRDALVALDQVAALGGDGAISLDDAQSLLGLVDSEKCVDLLDGICARKTADLLRVIDELVNGGRDLERIIRQVVRLVRDALILKAGGPTELVKRSESELKRLRDIVGGVSLAQMINVSQVLIGLEEQMRSGLPVRFAFELAVIKLTALAGASDIGDLVKKLEAAGKSTASAPATGAAGAQATPTQVSRVPSRAPAVREPAMVMYESDAAVADPPGVAESPAQTPGLSDAPLVADDPPVPAAPVSSNAGIGNPKAWLEETLESDPSLAEVVKTIKEVFSAREIALDGIPLA